MLFNKLKFVLNKRSLAGNFKQNRINISLLVYFQIFLNTMSIQFKCILINPINIVCTKQGCEFAF